MFVLPISGLPVRLRAPEGHDELLLAEGPGLSESDLELRMEAVQRLAPPADAARTWSQLPFGDVDAALLAFRRQIHGDRLIAEMRCPACSGWCDIPLSITAYLEAKRPRGVAGLTARADGWYAWRDLVFRLPTVGLVRGVLEAASSAWPRLLLESCLAADSAKPGADVVRRAGARLAPVLEKIAPPLAGEVEGRCPHCAAEVRGWFDPGAFVVAELQDRAHLIYDHVHLLAQAYGWSEALILALPARRRALYTARIQRDLERIQ